MEFQIQKDVASIIKVIGVGGGGGNAVNHMFSQGIRGVDFAVCNTDLQALEISPIPFKIQLGPSLTEGRGAGSIPEIGKNAAVENIEEITEYLEKDTKMVFVTAGMGGGTGTGAAPVIAKVAKDLGILTVGIVTVPFNFEGRKRRMQAEAGLESMRENVDTLLVINNERLREISGNLSIGEAFAQADEVLATAAKGIAEVIAVTGAINVDFNDVSTVMKDSGVAIMGSAEAEGDNRALKAVQKALESPLLNDNDIRGAEYVLLNITYGDIEVLMDEITEITDFIQDAAGSTADVIFGHGKDDSLGDKINVTLIATGFDSSPITGFEKAPKKQVTTLKEEVKNEILSPLESPTQQAIWADAKEVQEPQDAPFLKTTEETAALEETEEEAGKEFSWDNVASSQESSETNEKEDDNEEIITRLVLDEEQEATIDAKSAPIRSSLSPEEMQQKTADRLARIQEYTQRLKKTDGIQEFEKEPAYKRRNIELDESKPSNESNIGRFSVSNDENGSSLNGNNTFLHDNVD